MLISFPDGTVVENLSTNAGDIGLIPGSGGPPGEGNGNPLQHSCLENPHGQRSLAGYSPWGHKQLDPTEGVCTRTVAGSAPPQITLLAINCMFLGNTDAT